jgi:hypothetical protein
MTARPSQRCLFQVLGLESKKAGLLKELVEGLQGVFTSPFFWLDYAQCQLSYAHRQILYKVADQGTHCDKNTLESEDLSFENIRGTAKEGVGLC